MNLLTTPYIEQAENWPQEGYHIMAQYSREKIVVYQAYRKEISDFAVKNQHFGGPFSLNRMTWVKPNFLWMMYRSGWGQKEGQETTLAIHLKMEAFERYLLQSVYSSIEASPEKDTEKWKDAVKASDCRLQWDPDHDPFGNKLSRRAIQVGLRGQLTRTYATEDILAIEDISEFVKEQYEHVKSNRLNRLVTPKEEPLLFDNEKLNQHLKIKHHD